MPRSVVPILRSPRASSDSASRPRWCGRIRCARSESTQVVADLDAERLELARLLLERHGIDHDPVADDAQDPRVQDPRRNQVQHEALPAHDHGVARVVAAVVARHDLDARGEQVDDLALALVAPLGAGDHDVRHARTSLFLAGASPPANKAPQVLAWPAPDEPLLRPQQLATRRRDSLASRRTSRPWRATAAPWRSAETRAPPSSRRDAWWTTRSTAATSSTASPPASATSPTCAIPADQLARAAGQPGALATPRASARRSRRPRRAR